MELVPNNHCVKTIYRSLFFFFVFFFLSHIFLTCAVISCEKKKEEEFKDTVIIVYLESTVYLTYVNLLTYSAL